MLFSVLLTAMTSKKSVDHFLQVWSQISSISILLEMQILTPTQDWWIKTLEMGLGSLCFNKVSRGVSWMLSFENYWSKNGLSLIIFLKTISFFTHTDNLKLAYQINNLLVYSYQMHLQTSTTWEYSSAWSLKWPLYADIYCFVIRYSNTGPYHK